MGGALHRLNLSVPRVFYVNSHSSKELQGEGTAWRRVSKVLPRSAPVLHLSEYSVAEEIFQEHAGYVLMTSTRGAAVAVLMTSTRGAAVAVFMTSTRGAVVGRP